MLGTTSLTKAASPVRSLFTQDPAVPPVPGPACGCWSHSSPVSHSSGIQAFGILQPAPSRENSPLPSLNPLSKLKVHSCTHLPCRWLRMNHAPLTSCWGCTNKREGP